MMNKTVVITGASRGIGKSTVEQFAEKGYNVLALSRNEKKMRQDFRDLPNVTCKHLDLDSENVKEQSKVLFESLTSIDILINNAGYLVNKPFPDLTRSDIRKCYNVNVLGVIELVQEALKKMSTAHIVNISSMGGFQGSVKFSGLTAYSTSKAAICSFTELFAEEYKDSQISMNCLCLGAAQTEMLQEAFPGFKAPISSEKMASFIVDFAINADQWINGKIIPVSLSTP